MTRTWVNDDGQDEELVETPFRSILDRTENDTFFDLGDKQLWIPNRHLGNIDEMRGFIEVSEEFAEENGLT